MPSVVPDLKQNQPKQRSLMLGFRLICAVAAAWAVNWTLNQPVAANLIHLVPQMTFVAPAAAAVIGFVALAKRQGWGLIVAAANGLWTLILTVALTWLVYLSMRMGNHFAHGLIANFKDFMRILGSEIKPLAKGWIDLRLIGMLLGATVAASVVTEILHWILVRLRRLRGHDEEAAETA